MATVEPAPPEVGAVVEETPSTDQKLEALPLSGAALEQASAEAVRRVFDAQDKRRMANPALRAQMMRIQDESNFMWLQNKNPDLLLIDANGNLVGNEPFKVGRNDVWWNRRLRDGSVNLVAGPAPIEGTVPAPEAPVTTPVSEPPVPPTETAPVEEPAE